MTVVLRKLGTEGVLACVCCDSTNALVSGESGSEARVKRSLYDLIGTLKGRIASQPLRRTSRGSIQSRMPHARRGEVRFCGPLHAPHGRVRRAIQVLKDFPPLRDEEEARRLPPERVLYLCTGARESRARRSLVLPPANIPMWTSAKATP